VKIGETYVWRQSHCQRAGITPCVVCHGGRVRHRGARISKVEERVKGGRDDHDEGGRVCQPPGDCMLSGRKSWQSRFR